MTSGGVEMSKDRQPNLTVHSNTSIKQTNLIQCSWTLHHCHSTSSLANVTTLLHAI